MKPSSIFKTCSLAALLLGLQAPVAFAGATNADQNTNATPGDKSMTTTTPVEPGSDRRKGTTNTDNLNTPRNDQRNQQNSGNNTGSNKSNSNNSSGSSSGTSR